jgi:predicted transcriptional regulator
MSSAPLRGKQSVMGRPKGRTFKKTVAIRLDDELAAVLERMAKEEDRPLGAMVRIILRQALEAREVTESAWKKKGR